MKTAKKHLIIARAFLGILAIMIIPACLKKTPSQDIGQSETTMDMAEKTGNIEILGKDQAGNNITKETIESAESITMVITTPLRQLSGTLQLSGTNEFNELQIITHDNKAFTFEYQLAEKYHSQQGREITITGLTEERTFQDKKTGQTLKKNWFYPEK
ncbi:MAG: hypothetical protein JXR70_06405 [Spirochaetales bacterium]|nr:hypothetical protein [Spirochaetales bacterium]